MDLDDFDDLEMPTAEDVDEEPIEQLKPKPKEKELMRLEPIPMHGLDEIPLAILEKAAAKMQQHERYLAAEKELMEECDRTDGMVIYNPPDPWEISRRVTQQRRREIIKVVEQYAEKERIKVLAKKRQADPRFKKAESRIERDCLATKGEWRVKYEPPSETELASGTGTRRKRLQRRLDKYYRALAYTFAVETTYAVSKTPAHLRWIIKTSTIIRCKLGPKKCPCRGIRWDHVFFTWFEFDDGKGGEYVEDQHANEFKSHCSVCKNVYDSRFSGRAMDMFVKYCKRYVSELEEAAEDDGKASTYGTKVIITAADIQKGLVPVMKALIDEDVSGDGPISDERVAERRAKINDWIGEVHKIRVDEAKAEMKEWRDWLDKYGRTNRDAPTIPSGESCDLIHLLFPSLYEEELRLEGIELEK